MTDLPSDPIGFAALPEPLRARIEAELEPGERLVWAAQPDSVRPFGPLRRWASVWTWLIGWSVLGCVATAALLFVPRQYESGFGFLMFVVSASGVAVILLATHQVAERIKQGSWRRSARLDLYALTDRRALIWLSAGPRGGWTVEQYLPGMIVNAQIERLEYPDGSGNLSFRPGGYERGQGGFFGVAEVRRVDRLVRSILLLDPAGPPGASRSRTPHPNFDPEPDDFEEPF